MLRPGKYPNLDRIQEIGFAEQASRTYIRTEPFEQAETGQALRQLTRLAITDP